MIKKNYDSEILSNLNINENNIVFLAESNIEGFGEENSDTVYVIGERNIDYSSKDDESYLQISFFKCSSNIKYGVEYWDRNFIECLFNKINKIDFGNENIYTFQIISGLGGDINDIKTIIHRLNNSRCIHNDFDYKKLKANLECIKPNFCKLMTRYYINCADNIYYDIVANLEENLTVAKISSNNYLIHIMYSYIFSHNITIDRFKLIPKLLEKIDSDVALQFSDLYCNNHGDKIQININNTIQFCKKIIYDIENRKGGL